MGVTTENEHWVQAAGKSNSIASLTDAFGSADGTVEDVTASPTQAAINNNFQELSVKVNAILVVLRNYGLIAS